MPTRKPTPKSLDIPGQIQNLKKLDLKFKNEQKAAKTLNEISYYRLIKAYSLDFKVKNGSYDGKTKFEDIVELYNFNTELRELIVYQTERIEISLRTKIVNYFSVKYGSTGYKNSAHFRNKKYHDLFIEEVNREIVRNSRSPIVKNFLYNYRGGELPLYAIAEIISFGTLSKFFKNLHGTDKSAIADEYNVPYLYLESWIESIAYVRNICAHYGRLYNVRLDKTPKIPKDAGLPNFRIFAVLYCMKNILQNDKEWRKFVRDLNKLIRRYPAADIRKMGFPDKWKKVLKS